MRVKVCTCHSQEWLILNDEELLQCANCGERVSYYKAKDINVAILHELDGYKKAHLFVEHIKEHLKTMDVGDQVICKICGKTIDEIFKASQETPND